jgi:hypothetical protein
LNYAITLYNNDEVEKAREHFALFELLFTVRELWSCCGRVVVVLWSCCGRAVVVLWSCCGRAVVVLWSCCGRVVV